MQTYRSELQQASMNRVLKAHGSGYYAWLRELLYNATSIPANSTSMSLSGSVKLH